MLPISTPHQSTLRHLRSTAAPTVDCRVISFGVSALDSRLGYGGLRAGGLHEAAASTSALVDEAAAALFLAGVAAREAQVQDGLVLWVSSRNDLYAPGLEQAGLPSARVIFARPRDDAELLAVIEDAVRDGTPCAILGEVGKVSMVAARRLQLAAADADLPIMLLRRRTCADRDPFAVTGDHAMAHRGGPVGTARHRPGRTTTLVNRVGPAARRRAVLSDRGGLR